MRKAGNAPSHTAHALTPPPAVAKRYSFGRPIQFVPVSADDYAREMAGYQVPPEIIDLLLFLFGEVLDGRNAHTTGDVERALGRPPRDFFATVSRDLVEA